MGDAFDSLALGGDQDRALSIRGLHLAAVIILSCAACITPIELFILEVWSFHGFSSLLFVVPLVAGGTLVRLLPEAYHRIRRFEESGRLYAWMGVRYFKRFVPNGDYSNRLLRASNPGHRIIRDKASMVRFEASTRLAERVHLGALLMPLPCAAYALHLGWNGFALWLLLPNVPFHVYPILVQRYSRGRIRRVLNARSAPVRRRPSPRHD